jgi:ADP-ribosyl-[dinitrogen reductase] hydrolase
VGTTPASGDLILLQAEARLTTVEQQNCSERHTLQKSGMAMSGSLASGWQLLHAPSLEEGVVDTVMRGGDTDTNAAIAGALLSAVYRREAVPAQWVEKLQTCRPEAGNPRVRHPRPECFWPVDELDIAIGCCKTQSFDLIP